VLFKNKNFQVKLSSTPPGGEGAGGKIASCSVGHPFASFQPQKIGRTSVMSRYSALNYKSQETVAKCVKFHLYETNDLNRAANWLQKRRLFSAHAEKSWR
jgi:hypothetical protein